VALLLPDGAMMRKTGILYIVPTPIGNLADITYRAVEVLRSAAVIAAEDTRVSGKLLKHYGIGTPMLSYHKFNERSRVDELIQRLQQGEDVAVISDAGTPGISDPAAVIVAEVAAQQLRVEVLPGATAFVPAVVASALPVEHFCFIGFLPDKQQQRDALLERLAPLPFALVLYESPHRILRTAELLRQKLGNRRISIGRELSKLHETYYRITLDELLADPEQITCKGEFVVVIEGASSTEYTDETLRGLLQNCIQQGMHPKDALKAVQKQTGQRRNRLYDLLLGLDAATDGKKR
jgi:16S rRNA (cytidine1402-2'-O)-methyltransferase